jgi:signal transduction histidine kinase
MPATEQPRTVLIVDDDKGLARVIEKRLLREGYATAIACSGEEALMWLNEHSADLMLLDLKLPDFTGGDLIDRLEALGRAAPFIIITGQGDERVAVKMMKRGALDYLIKDVQFLEFVPTVVDRACAQLDQKKRLAAADENRKRLEKEILEISEREQQRIGQDLHDDLGQQLAGIWCLNRVLEGSLAAQNSPEAENAAKITGLLKNALALTRTLARGLHPVALDVGGLGFALEELAQRTSDMFRVKCQSKCPREIALDNITATHLYRIAQEAVTNAVKHGRSPEIEIELSSNAHQTVLSIKDCGCGMPDGVPEHEGMGLRIMGYRAGIIKGTLCIQNVSTGMGTVVTCAIATPQ